MTEDFSAFADMANEFQKKFAEKLLKEEQELQKPNILIAGRTGVGKSTLINAVFGEKVAPVGSGEPVTDSYERYAKEHSLVTIYDSAGWVGGAENEQKFFKDTEAFLNKTTDLKDRIHIIWYALDAPGARFTKFDQKILKELFKDIAVLFVLTKGDIATDEQITSLRTAIEKANISNSVGILDVAADPPVIRGRRTSDPYGLEALVEKTLKMLPELVKRAFIAAQIVSLKAKDIEARNNILWFASGAGAVGFTPIPFSDWPILVGIQATMTARIALIYGFTSEGLASSLSAGLAGGFIAMWVGKGLVDLLKLIPGLGTAAGSIIDGSVSSSITAAMGFTVAALFHDIIERSLADKNFTVTPKWAQDFIKDRAKKTWDIIKKKGFKNFDNLSE